MLDWKLVAAEELAAMKARLADMAATNLKLVTDKQGMVADVLERRLKVVEAKPEVQAFVDVARRQGQTGESSSAGGAVAGAGAGRGGGAVAGAGAGRGGGFGAGGRGGGRGGQGSQAPSRTARDAVLASGRGPVNPGTGDSKGGSDVRFH